ncbi:MAG TPA: heme exporter protein CcmD [Steroidobacteraceae bacterium]|nr:heme exporter protein CcmD [Steroidobacteraceae bacterium]
MIHFHSMIQFHSMGQFLAMGKYAAYVWPAYAIVAAAVVLNILWARALLAHSQTEARRRLSMGREPEPTLERPGRDAAGRRRPQQQEGA